jgi:hypothetical protein
MGFEGLAGLLKGDRIASPRADLLLFRKPSPAPEAPTKAQAAKSLAAAAKQAEKDARRRADERRKAASRVAGSARPRPPSARPGRNGLARRPLLPRRNVTINTPRRAWRRPPLASTL